MMTLREKTDSRQANRLPSHLKSPRKDLSVCDLSCLRRVDRLSSMANQSGSKTWTL